MHKKYKYLLFCYNQHIIFLKYQVTLMAGVMVLLMMLTVDGPH